jgi:predicted outer membrane repeat protein
MRMCQVIVVGVLVAAAAASAPAATMRVDWSGQGDYLTIQEGIDASTHGDTVLVAPGTYTGALNRDIDFDGRNINLIAEGGRDLTTIDCQSEGRAFVFSGAESPYATVEGFTVRNGSAEEGGAVHITNSSISFMECAFEDNSAGFGGVFFLGQEACPYIESCTFDNNYASEYGGGIYTYSARPYVVYCDFTNNSAGKSGGAISCKTWTVASILSSSFVGNTSHDGGAIYMGTLFAQMDENLEPSKLLDNWFADNSAERGGAVFLNSFTWVTVSWSTFARNSAREGGALYCYMDAEGDLTVQMCTIVENSAEVGGGICIAGSSPDNGLTVLQTIIAFSTEGRAQHRLDYAPILSDLCCAYGNQGGDLLYGATDRILQVDPLFCDMYGGDYNLCENSECRSANNIWGFTFGSYRGICGPCSSPVETKSWGAIKAMYR